MPEIVYTGPHGAVNVPALGVDAEFGVPFTVDEGAAVALTSQADWSLVKPSKSTKAVTAVTKDVTA